MNTQQIITYEYILLSWFLPESDYRSQKKTIQKMKIRPRSKSNTKNQAPNPDVIPKKNILLIIRFSL